MKKLKKRYRNLGIVLIIFVLLIVGVAMFHHSDDTSDGVAYLEAQENLKVSKVSSKLTKKRKKERKQAVKEGKIDVFGLFDDYVIFGDSRVMGFSTHGFLTDSRILGVSGGKITDVDDLLTQVESLQPSNIYLSYGVNDMGLDLNANNDYGTYADLYEHEVNEILNVVPNANIYVNSIIPTTQEAVEEQNEKWGDVDKYNKQLKKMCKKNGWTYINNDDLADGGNADIYQDDGIHYLSDFYYDWAENMVSASE